MLTLNSTTTFSACLLATVLASTPFIASCNIVTPLAYAIDGAGQIEAEYILLDRKTVVFVDDPDTIFPRTSLRLTLGDAVSFDLMQRELLTSTVATRDAVAASRNGAAGNAAKLTSITSIGRALDCAQVIHIQPTVFDIDGRSDDRGLRPTAVVRVKIIDVENKMRLYPGAEIQPEGREITAIIREKDSNGLRTRAGRTQIEDELVKKLALEIERLFYKHDRVDLGENLGTRRQ